MRSRHRFPATLTRTFALLAFLTASGRAGTLESARSLAAAGDAAGALARMETGRGVRAPVSVATLRSRVLSTDQVLLEYAAGDRDLVVVLVSQDRCRAAIVRAGARTLDSLAVAMRDDLALESPTLAPARSLYRTLVEPVAQDLPPESRLVIAADGPLEDLAYAALHDGDAFLCERHAVSRIRSASALAALAARRIGRRVPTGLVMSEGPRPAGEIAADTALVENAPAALQADVRRLVFEERLPPDVALQRAQREAIRSGRPAREWANAAAWGRMRAVRSDGRFPAWVVPLGLGLGFGTLLLALRLTSRGQRADESA